MGPGATNNKRTNGYCRAETALPRARPKEARLLNQKKSIRVQRKVVFALVTRGRFFTSTSKFNIEPNGGIIDVSPKTTARHPM